MKMGPTTTGAVHTRTAVERRPPPRHPPSARETGRRRRRARPTPPTPPPAARAQHPRTPPTRRWKFQLQKSPDAETKPGASASVPPLANRSLRLPVRGGARRRGWHRAREHPLAEMIPRERCEDDASLADGPVRGLRSTTAAARSHTTRGENNRNRHHFRRGPRGTIGVSGKNC